MLYDMRFVKQLLRTHFTGVQKKYNMIQVLAVESYFSFQVNYKISIQSVE